MNRLALASLLSAAALAGGCEAETSSQYPGAWKPPIVQVPPNDAYPACAGDAGCPWGERCGDGQCAADGLGRTPAPAFALVDLNDNSGTDGTTVSLEDQHGRVTVVYFGLSTCPNCWQQAVHIQTVLESLAAAGGPAATALVINHPQGDGTVWEMGRFVRLPILQDGPDAATWAAYGAGKDTVAVVDPNGFVATRWQVLDLSKQAADLEAAIRAAGW